MNSILQGIRVLEVSTAIQGPAAGQFLADLGAEVIKIEPPMGDSARYIGRLDATRDAAKAADAGSQFVAVNRGKQSVCLDAHSELGQFQEALALCDRALALDLGAHYAAKRASLDWAQ